jgi:DNA-binding PadR family transcriptional regulator
MTETHAKKSIALGDLMMYLQDLVRMGFVFEHVGEDGKLYYKLTELGKKSGLEDLPNSS